MGITSMKLLSLRLRNFKGLSEFAIEPVGANLIVCGDNATGKTTISDAYHWLIDGKDSSGSADFGIKTLSQDGSETHNLNHEAEIELEVDGKRLALMKSYHEIWTKKRGSADATFSGHTTDYYVSGVPVSKSEYDAKVASICNLKRFRLLVNPEAFAALHWQDRRRMLMEICGDVSDDDAIASNPSLSALPAILEGRSVDDYRKVAKARQAKINDELRTLPARIDEAGRQAAAVTGKKVEIAPLEEALEKARQALGAAGSESQVLALKNQLARWESEMLDRVNELKRDSSEGFDTALQEVNAATKRLSNVEVSLSDLRSEMARASARLEEARTAREEKLAEYRKIEAEVFEFTGETVCLACGQDLPAEQIASLRAKAEAAFNTSKASRMESVITTGKHHAQLMANASEALESAAPNLDELQETKAALEIQIAELRQVAESKRTTPPSPESDPTYKGLSEYCEKAREDIRRAELGEKVQVQELQAAVTAASENLQHAMAENAKVSAAEAGVQRVAELGNTEKALAREFEELGKHLFLIEEFIRAKVVLLTDRINSKFKMAQFKLFEEQVNGGLAECCDITYRGVAWSDLNNGARVNVGLDIINTLARHEGFAPPIFIDNAESVTSIIPTAGQQVRLVVSASDPELRIESAKELALA